jgi:hypothetical protein
VELPVIFNIPVELLPAPNAELTVPPEQFPVIERVPELLLNAP